MQGKIKFFNDEKFYGVVQIEGDQTFFFPGSAVLGEPVAKGDAVTFRIDDDPRRHGELKAIDVQKLVSATASDPTRLFFGNAPFTMTEEELREHFGQCGSVVSVAICCDQATGESRGFGFIQMADPRSALNCIAQLHGKEVSGRRITVHLATDRPKVRPQVEQRSC